MEEKEKNNKDKNNVKIFIPKDYDDFFKNIKNYSSDDIVKFKNADGVFEEFKVSEVLNQFENSNKNVGNFYNLLLNAVVDVNSPFHVKILRSIYDGVYTIVFNHKDFLDYNPVLLERFFKNPFYALELFELAVNNADFNGLYNFSKKIPSLKVIFKFKEDYYNVYEKAVSDIRVVDVGKMFYFKGILKSKTKVKPFVVKKSYECLECGSFFSKDFVFYNYDAKRDEPKFCSSCGSKKIKEVDVVQDNFQVGVLEEDYSLIKGRNELRRINVVFPPHLTSPDTDLLTGVGSRIAVFGRVDYKLDKKPFGNKNFDFVIRAFDFNVLDDDFYSFELKKEDVDKILAFSKRSDVYDVFIKSIAPNIVGLEDVKEGVLLQLFGGVEQVKKDKTRIRGDIHVLIIGEPGTAKSQLLRRVEKIAPRSKFASGRGSSGVGLTASVVRNEITGSYSLEAGAIVLANNGFLLLDEIDKVSHEDLSNLHEAMEQQTISINKASVQATLPAKTSVLASGNPKLGSFDNFVPFIKQVNLPPAILNRFDLIFILKDEPNSKKDTFMAGRVFDLHSDTDFSDDNTILDDDFFKKYLFYARNNVFPKLTPEIKNVLVSYYSSNRNNVFVGNDDAGSSIFLNLRTFDGLIRLSKASARVRLSSVVEKQDVDRAIRLLEYSIKGVAVDVLGNVDVNILESGVSRNVVFSVSSFKKEVIDYLKENVGSKFTLNQVLDVAKNKGFSEEYTNMFLEKLIEVGDLFRLKYDLFSLE